MLDIKFIRENQKEVKKGVAAKQLDPKVVDRVLELDEKRRKLLVEVEALRNERNRFAKEKDIEGGKEVKKKLQKLEPNFSKVEKDFKEIMLQVPNPPADDVPVGKNERENKILDDKTWGKKPKFDFKPKDHLELGEALDIIDVKRAVKVSGSRFSYLKGDAALLEFALINFALETLVKEGFTPIMPPVLIKKDSMQAMGYLDHGGEEEMYVWDKDKLVLVGTSEQAIGPMHMNEVFNAKDLPKRYVGFSHCFRREAGSYGKDTRGILRLHQFDKVEMFSYTKPEDGNKEHEYLLELEEKFYQALKIPYQVVQLCSGDLAVPSTRTYDIEVWLPGQDKYREATSTSTTTDFQSRRLNIKYQEGRKTEYVHMLNGTVFAIGRTIIAIMENFQQKDGSIKIPKVLQKWMGKEKIKLTLN